MLALLALPRAALTPAAAPAARSRARLLAPAARGRARLLEATGAAVVHAASRVRGERVIHAKGTTVRARLLVPGGAGLGVPLLDDAGRHDCVVRVSRSIGLPERLPDIVGIAVRVHDAHGPGRHQDLLLDSALSWPLARQVPVLRFDLLSTLFSSLTPYELAGRRWLLALLPDPSAPSTRRLADVAGRSDGTRMRLAVASARGPWRPVAVLELGGPVPGGRQVRFAPDVTGGGIRPAGWLHDLRRRAYDASHVGPDA